MSLFGGWLVYRWSAELGGQQAGLVSLGLWTFSPNILATGSSICPDLTATVLGLLCLKLFAGWLDEPTWERAVRLGLILGITELTKFTWVLFYPLLPLAWIGLRFRERAVRQTDWRSETSQVVVIAFLCWNVIVLGYGAERMFQPIGEFRFVSETLRGEGVNRFEGTVLDGVPFPLPARVLEGIDIQKRDFESRFRSFLLGEWKRGGWKHYYVVALALKTPASLWPILLLALPQIRKWEPRTVLSIIGIPLAMFVFVSFQDGFSHHVRYVLFVIPALFIVAGQAVRSSHKSVRRLAVVLTALFALSSLSQFPHVQAYFSWMAGGPRNGHKLLIDSNIDWGQDITTLKSWLKENPRAAEKLRLVYFGRVDPADLGIEYELPLRGRIAPGDDQDVDGLYGPQPGWYAVSATMLAGYHYSIPNGKGGREYVSDDRYGYFRNFEPVARPGNSIFVYHLDAREIDRFSRNRASDNVEEQADSTP